MSDPPRSPVLAALDGESTPRTLFLVYLLTLCATHGGVMTGVRVWVSIFAVAALLAPVLSRRSDYWFVVAFTLALDLTEHYASSANHYWGTLYLTLFLALDAYRRERGVSDRLNGPRALLLIIFGFAALQKLISGYFMSGRLLGAYMLRGESLFRTLSLFDESHEQTVQAYFDTYADVASHTSLGGFSLPIELPFELFPQLALAFALSVVVFETGMFLALTSRRFFESALMPPLMLAFVWGTLLMRGEFFFFALICTLFLLARPGLALFWKVLVLGSAITFIALDVGGVGSTLA